MSQVIRMVSDLAKLPVGTKVLDKDGDVLRRAPEGWTYRNTDQLTNPGSVMHHRLLGQYMPMVTLDDPAPAPLPMDALDDPVLHQVIADYIEQEFAARYLATAPADTDPYKLAAYHITQAIKEHLK